MPESSGATERELTGSCLCGRVHYRIASVPAFTVKCHCRDCQKISGGGHLPQFAVPRDASDIEGGLKVHDLKSLAGFAVRSAFCPECGSPIWKSTERLPDLLFFAAGSLDDPTIFAPGMVVHEETRLPWDCEWPENREQAR